MNEFEHTLTNILGKDEINPPELAKQVGYTLGFLRDVVSGKSR